MLAIRDYFVERVEHSKQPPAPKAVVKMRPFSTISAVPNEENDDDDDPETDTSVPLPDSWMISYLQVKRLRYLQRASHRRSSAYSSLTSSIHRDHGPGLFRVHDNFRDKHLRLLLLFRANLEL